MSKDAGIYAWIKREEESGNIYMEADGFWVWARGHTSRSLQTSGFLNEYALTEMAKYLAARNAPWQWQIDHDPAIAGTPVNSTTPTGWPIEGCDCGATGIQPHFDTCRSKYL